MVTHIITTAPMLREKEMTMFMYVFHVVPMHPDVGDSPAPCTASRVWHVYAWYLPSVGQSTPAVVAKPYVASLGDVGTHGYKYRRTDWL
jgi:hypothetical protein